MARGKLARASQSPVAAAIRKKIGAGPDDDVNVATPQFTREPGAVAPSAPPSTPEDWKALRSQGKKALYALGLRPWRRKFQRRDGSEFGPMLMLLPGEWYPYIPEGYEIVNISFDPKQFKRGETPNDIRGGALAFGILLREPN